MAGYRELLRTPGVARIIAAQLSARFPGGMVALAVLIHVEQTFHSYGAAGLTLAAVSLGQAVAGPVTSRWMGRWGMRPVLLATTTVTCLAIAALALVPAPLPVVLLFGLVAGLSAPPVQSAVRTIYPKMVPSSRLTSLYSLDASLQEIIWVVGPVLITYVCIQFSSVIGLLLIVAVTLAGGVWFLTSPELGRVRIPPSRRGFGRVLTNRVVLLTTVLGFLLVGSAAAAEAGVVAVFGEGAAEAGLVLAAYALGSLAGGLAFGHRPMAPWSLARRFVIITVGVSLTLVMLDAWWLALTLFVAGLGFAPVLAVCFSITSASVKFSDSAEAYGWINTGQLIGAALGSACAGFMIDGTGPRGALIVAVIFVVFGTLVAAVCVRWVPDMRHRDASPMPDTDVIPLP